MCHSGMGSLHSLVVLGAQPNVAGCPGWTQHVSQSQKDSLPQAEQNSLLPPLKPNHRLSQVTCVHSTYQLYE